MALRWRSEYLLLLLVLLSLAAVQFSDLLLRRSRVVVPGEHVHVKLLSDRLNGGNSEITQRPGPGLDVACTLREGFGYPYCAISLEFDRQRLKGIDMSEVRQLRLWLDYEGPAPTLRMLLRNANPAYGIPPSATDAAKYNQIEINAKSIMDGVV